MNILVSAPSMYQGLPFLPYVYTLLRSKCDQNEKLNGLLNWLEPVYMTEFDIDGLIGRYADSNIDVLALSCYEWNWEFQKTLASQIKKLNPNCKIVLGGPQPDWKDSDFFKKYEWADFVIRGEGETPFMSLIEVLAGVEPQSKFPIPGVWFDGEGGNFQPKEVFKEPVEHFESSAYLSYQNQMKNISGEVNSNPALSNVWVNWETTRGCPYSCQFCDWGSSTFSKIRQVPMERLEKELKFFSDCKVDTIYITDANFGILDRDLVITQMLVDAREKTGYPKTVFFNAAKNNPKRLKEIISNLNKAGLLRYCIQNNLQSTQPDVLAIMKRINMKEHRQRDFIQDLLDDEIPMGSALIMGNPGESLTSFQNSLFDSMEWGMHAEIRIFNWALLPNAPAASPEYMDKYKIKTVVRPTIRNVVNRQMSRHPFYGMSEYLVSHSELTEEEWVENSVFSTFVLAAHNLSLTKFISIFLRMNRDVPYSTFYRHIFKQFSLHRPNLVESVYQTFQGFLTKEDGILNMGLFDEDPVLTDPEAWLFCKIIEEKDSFYQFLESSLEEFGYSSDFEMKDALNYNKEIIIDPEYRPQAGKSFQTQFAWKQYFETALAIATPEFIPLARNGRVENKISMKNTGPYFDIPLDFENSAGEFDWQKYMHSVCGYKSSRHYRSYFHDYEESVKLNSPKIELKFEDRPEHAL